MWYNSLITYKQNLQINARGRGICWSCFHPHFSDEEFEKAVRYCRIRGCKVYVTMNTLVGDREMEQAAELARRVSDLGADAILVQDIGLLSVLKRIVPDIPLHASTQMSIHDLAGVEAAAEMGLTRAVLARRRRRT